MINITSWFTQLRQIMLGRTTLQWDLIKLAEECSELSAVITSSLVKEKDQSVKIIEELGDVIMNVTMVYHALSDKSRAAVDQRIAEKTGKLEKYAEEYKTFGKLNVHNEMTNSSNETINSLK